jgi:hypothetical protein
MAQFEFQNSFPGLRRGEFAVTSHAGRMPNCVAYAAYDFGRYWDPNMIGVRGYFWPPGAERGDTVECWISAFRQIAFRPCDSGGVEPGFEKIAIYTKDGQDAEHVARQLKNGVWTSKLGPDEDIYHQTLTALEGGCYGSVAAFLKRRQRAWDEEGG